MIQNPKNPLFRKSVGRNYSCWNDLSSREKAYPATRSRGRFSLKLYNNSRWSCITPKTIVIFFTRVHKSERSLCDWGGSRWGGTCLVKDKCLKDHKDCQWDHLNERVHHLAVDRRMAKRVLNSHTDIKVHVKCLVGNRFNKHHNLCLLHWASNTASAEVLHSHAEWGRFIFSPLDSSLASGIWHICGGQHGAN